MQQIPLTWFLQAFYRENHIWDWEHWVISPGRQMRDCWKSSRQSAYFYFLFSMWKACTSQYHSIGTVAKLLMHHPHFPGRESYTPFTVIISILYPKRPSEQGASQGSGAVAATSQFLDFSFRNGRFQGPEQWIFCSTSASLCRGWVVDWEWAGVCGDCSVVCPGLPRIQQSLMERTLALELVRPVFVSQLCPYLCAFGKITF